ncbi:MAG: Holliday junction resolvase RuvX [Bacteroidia bacterium]|nr:Holliday junction resolvase RuvX [Bacteroidia bacterium]
MPRILAIDYGKKRTGLAWTDPMQIIATALDTVDTSGLKDHLGKLIQNEAIEKFLLGYPTRTDGSDTHVTQDVRNFASYLEKTYPEIKLELWDERFTSRMAMQAMLDGGMSKKKRRQKGQLDKLSATIMLQEYLGQ